jgi:hypothetical protein
MQPPTLLGLLGTVLARINTRQIAIAAAGAAAVVMAIWAVPWPSVAAIFLAAAAWFLTHLAGALTGALAVLSAAASSVNAVLNYVNHRAKRLTSRIYKQRHDEIITQLESLGARASAPLRTRRRSRKTNR